MTNTLRSREPLGADAPVVIADANVFYSNVQRNVLMTLAVERLFDLRWTSEIEDEWVRNLVANRPDLDPARVRRTAGLMRTALPQSDIKDHFVRIVRLQKTDKKDRHVAAAAIACRPSTVITWNIKDFDPEELGGFDVTVANPDAFLCRVFDNKPEVAFAAALKSFDFRNRANPQRNWADYVDAIGNSGEPNCLRAFAEKLREFKFLDDLGASPDDAPDTGVPGGNGGPR